MGLISDVTSAIETIQYAAEHELGLDELAVEQIHSGLLSVLKTLDDDPFGYMATIQPESFGTTGPATALSFHHRLAQDVMNQTLDGLRQDLQAFAQNLIATAEVIRNADSNAAGDVKKRAALLDSFSYLDHHSHADDANHRARQHLPLPAPAPSTGGDR